ncbi:hypothetical protein GCM10010909_07250 [Acidocella aquatica]|uniref:Uncharacterized protein n=1 Tax=Acidocella aquatica TaxID=1922313 RepID=A0ABQ6A345_9PROT|nr:FAD-dependent oxidoreductase [Acidocella aquatica]GLR66047.1 hypothetical protein GCM10010909_07250 [Acidocella aquatica]
MNTYSNLFSPGRIATLETRNRIVVAAMGVSLSEPDGTVGERLIAYHEEQARGGAGLIISGVTGVGWPVGAVQPNQTAISDDCFLPGLSTLTERVHRHGAKIAAQLHHGGLVAGYSSDAFGEPLWAPCAPPALKGDFMDYFLPEETSGFSGKAPQLKILEQADIDAVVASFAAAGARAVKAGFDAIELHAGHGYLLSSFLSPKTNTRTDRYGGALENRARLLLEIIAAVRAATEPDFPLWCKLDACEFGKEGGITLEQAIATARLAEAAGADAITVTSYHNAGIGKLHSASNIPHQPETNIPAAQAIKAAVTIPVIASGRVEPAAADAHIGAGKYDFIAMGRKLLADPALPNKLAAGQEAGIRPCIYCYTCVSCAYVREPVRCAVNPETGFEWERLPEGHNGRKRAVVVGSGPAGMEAACRLADSGHHVTLLEKSNLLGGTLRFAALAYPANERLLEWLQNRIARSSVDVRLKAEASPELLRTLAPDVVIVATGARRDMPEIPGSHLPHVYSGDDLRQLLLGQSSAELKRKTNLLTRLATKIGAAIGSTAKLEFVRKVSRRWMPLGRNIVIIGGELVGIELAEFLNERGRQVAVLESAPRLGKGLLLVRRLRLLPELKEHGVALYGGVSNIVIARAAVTFNDARGEPRSLPANHVIVAMGATGDTSLADQLREDGFNVLTAGDCTGVSYIEGAIRGAAKAVGQIRAM